MSESLMKPLTLALVKIIKTMTGIHRFFIHQMSVVTDLMFPGLVPAVEDLQAPLVVLDPSQEQREVVAPVATIATLQVVTTSTVAPLADTRTAVITLANK